MKDYSTKLKEIEDTLGETIGEGWDFSLDPISLSVSTRLARVVTFL